MDEGECEVRLNLWTDRSKAPSCILDITPLDGPELGYQVTLAKCRFNIT